MKRLTKTLISLSASLLLSLSGLIGLGAAHATGAASMYLSPSSGSLTTGSTLSVDVYENSGATSTNAVQANLSYPTSLLTYAGYSNSDDFSFAAQSPPATDSSGTLDFGRGTTNPVSGAQLVVTVKFTVKATGTATLDFASGSSVVAADNSFETLTTSGGNYTLTAPAAPTNNSPGSSSNSSSSSSSGSSSKSSGSSGSTKSTGSTTNTTTTTAQPSTSNVTITKVDVSGLGNTAATITWQTSAATTSEVDYGLTADYGASAVDGTMTTQHKVTLDSKNLLAGTLFHFVVKGTDSSGAVTVSSDMTFRTTGGQPQPAKTAGKNTSALTWILIAVGIIVLVIILVLVRLALIKRRQARAELDRHFPKLPGGGTPPVTGSGTPGNIINPNGSPPKE